jgi:hypothetical protein
MLSKEKRKNVQRKSKNITDNRNPQVVALETKRLFNSRSAHFKAAKTSASSPSMLPPSPPLPLLHALAFVCYPIANAKVAQF